MGRKTLTAQEYYDELVIRAFEGRLPAKQDAQCLYRTRDGRACVAGILVPDERYDPRMEDVMQGGGKVQSVVINFGANVFDLPPGMTLDDLARLQYLHDDHTISSTTLRGFTIKFLSQLNDVWPSTVPVCFLDLKIQPRRVSNAVVQSKDV